MEQQEELAVATILAAYVLEGSDDEEKPPKKRRSVWTRNWIALRQTEGFYAKLLVELESEDPKVYQQFVRMTAEQFHQLRVLVTPHVQKQDTNMRKSISAGERLLLTLRYLATGDTYQSLSYLFRIPISTISEIVPEVLDAIYNVLVGEYIQVNWNHSFN